MVLPAQELEIREAGRAAFGPVDDVLRVAVGRTASAARMCAVSIACDEGIPLRRAHRARRAADIEDLARPVGDDAADLAVAEHAFERAAGEHPDVRGFGPELGEQVVRDSGDRADVDDQADMRAAAPRSGAVV